MLWVDENFPVVDIFGRQLIADQFVLPIRTVSTSDWWTEYGTEGGLPQLFESPHNIFVPDGSPHRLWFKMHRQWFAVQEEFLSDSQFEQQITWDEDGKFWYERYYNNTFMDSSIVYQLATSKARYVYCVGLDNNITNVAAAEHRQRAIYRVISELLLLYG